MGDRALVALLSSRGREPASRRFTRRFAEARDSNAIVLARLKRQALDPRLGAMAGMILSGRGARPCCFDLLPSRAEVEHGASEEILLALVGAF